DGQQLDIVPVFQLFGARAQEESDTGNVFAKRRQTFLSNLFGTALPDHVGALPIVTTVNCHQNLSGADASESCVLVVWVTTEAHPEHVDGGAQIDDLKSGIVADDGVAAIG